MQNDQWSWLREIMDEFGLWFIAVILVCAIAGMLWVLTP